MPAFQSLASPAYQTLAIKENNPLEALTQRTEHVNELQRVARANMQQYLAQSAGQARVAVGAIGMPSGLSGGQQRIHLKKYLAAQYPDMLDSDMQSMIDAHLGGGYGSY